MKLIESKAEYLPQAPGLEGMYKQIELCGRTCYKSIDKITPDSAKLFVDRMIASKHTATLEHGTVYLFFKACAYSKSDYAWLSKYEHNPYSKIDFIGTDDNEPDEDGEYRDFMGNESEGLAQFIITTNYRVLVENGWLDDLKYISEPTEYHEPRYTFKFTCSRAIANELVRHRKFSFAQESTRYVKYGEGNRGGELQVIIPSWSKLIANNSYDLSIAYNADITEDINGNDKQFLEACCTAEEIYEQLLHEGLKPQDARDILPLATKTELCMTGFASDWRFLLDLRLFDKTGAAHPDMKQLMQKLKTAAQEAGIWDDIMKYPSKFD